MFARDLSSFTSWAPRVLEELVRDSGLAAYAELRKGQAPPLGEAQLLREALMLTERRYAATPEQQRGFTALEAIARLMRLTTAHAVMAMWTFDARILDAFPTLAPLQPLSGLVDVMVDLLQVARDWVAGRNVRV